MRTLLIAAVALGGSAFLSPILAQNARASTARGLAWVGCWEAADGIQSQGRVCVIPEGARDLRIVSFDAQDKATESTLRLNGERTPVSAEGCTGWEQARLSADGERILVDAQLQCGDSPQRTIAEAFVITPTGFWLQARGTGIAMVANARVRLYRAVDSYASFPADIRAALAPQVQEAEYARNAMSRVSARDLAELESMGVAAPVIDLVVAASYPSSFVIDTEGATAATGSAGAAVNTSSLNSNPFYWSNGFPMLSYYDLAMLENCMRLRMFSCGIGSSRYGYSVFGSGNYRDPYYGGYYGGYNGGYGPGQGIPVVVRPAAAPSDYPGNRGGGRAVSGSGYSSGSSGSSGGSTRSASPRSGNTGTSQNSGSAGASSSSGSGGSGGSSSAGSSGGSETRTAKPRTP